MINEAFRCINCRFHDKARAICRRHPKPYQKLWPTVQEDDWCGEFKFKLGEVVFIKGDK